MPLRQATTSGRNAAAFISWPLACMLKAWCGPYSVPVGMLTFQSCSAWSTSLMPICRAASLSGSTCTRTAYFGAPEHLHLRHAVDHGDALRDHGLGVVVQLAQGQRSARSAPGT